MLIWLTSSIGKLIAKWTAFAAIAVAVCWKIYVDGCASERAKPVAKKTYAARNRKEDQ
jgi:hypothetical protein